MVVVLLLGRTYEFSDVLTYIHDMTQHVLRHERKEKQINNNKQINNTVMRHEKAVITHH